VVAYAPMRRVRGSASKTMHKSSIAPLMATRAAAWPRRGAGMMLRYGAGTRKWRTPEPPIRAQRPPSERRCGTRNLVVVYFTLNTTSRADGTGKTTMRAIETRGR